MKKRVQNYGVIAADIVGSTSIPVKERKRILNQIEKLLVRLKVEFDAYGRIVKGDQIEIVLDDPKNTLRVAILLKAYIKGLNQSKNKAKGSQSEELRFHYFGKHAVRIVIAIDEMSMVDRRRGVLEGEAIYTAGRLIGDKHTFDKEKIIIKSTIDFISSNKDWENQFDVIVKLLDVLISSATSRQCEILVHRLMNKSEEEIKDIIKKTQSAVNQSLNAVGWRAIQKALNYFENTVQ